MADTTPPTNPHNRITPCCRSPGGGALSRSRRPTSPPSDDAAQEREYRASRRAIAFALIGEPRDAATMQAALRENRDALLELGWLPMQRSDGTRYCLDSQTGEVLS